MKFPIELNFDWKESADSVIEEIAPILRSAGIFVYVNPATEGSDDSTYIFTKKKMTRKDMVKYLFAQDDRGFIYEMADHNGVTPREEANSWIDDCFGGDPKPIA